LLTVGLRVFGFTCSSWRVPSLTFRDNFAEVSAGEKKAELVLISGVYLGDF